MTEPPADPGATGYDWLSSKAVEEGELRRFLLDCFSLDADELFVSHGDRVDAALSKVPHEDVFAAFCTYWPVSGHFAMSLSVGIAGRLAERVGRHEFAERFARHFDAYVLYGDAEPPGLWTLVLADGGRLRVAMEEDEDRCTLYAATAPVPGLPGVRVEQGLWYVQ
jgi:hypothetical protein